MLKTDALTTNWVVDTQPPRSEETVLTGVPSGTTTNDFATVTVVNPDIDSVQYRINGGTWIPSTKTIALTGLADGAITLDLIGADAAGNWMLKTDALTTNWVVDTTPEPIVNRTQIGWTNPCLYTLSISNFPAGADMELALCVDVNSDGVVNTDDFTIAVFDVTDGEVNPWGAETFVDDNDGITNGRVEATIPYYGPGYDLTHTIGDYIWNIDIDLGAMGSATTTVAMAVTQQTSSVWISGVVCEAIAPSNRVAGACVQMEYASPLVGVPPSTWTDETGAFSLYVPDDISPSDVAGVFASAKGRLAADKKKDDDALLSVFFFTNSLTSGENALPEPLQVAPASASPDLAEISGTVYNAQFLDGNFTNVPLHGVLVLIGNDPHYGEIDLKALSWDITDRDGHFSMTFPTNYTGKARVSCASPSLNQRGIVGTFVDLDPEYPTTSLELFCSSADAFVRSKVTDQASGAPIIGANVIFESREAPWTSKTFSMDDGTYEVGLLGGMYDAFCERKSLEYRYYISTTFHSDLYLSPGMIFDGTLPFAVHKGAIISGQITDTNGIAIPHGMVALVEPEDRWIKRINDAPIEPDGTYNLLAPLGEWYLRTEIFDKTTIDLYYTNHYTGNIDSADPLTVTASGLNNIDFALPTGGRVEGEIYTEYGTLAHGIQVRVMRKTTDTQWECIGANLMDHNDGRYGIVVPAGSNTYVKTDIEPGHQYPATWYGNTGSRDLATPFSITNNHTISNINIQLFPGYETHGEVRNQTNMIGITGATITAYDDAMNHYGTMHAYTNGNYTDFYVPTNVPLHFFATAQGFEGEYFDNTYTAADAQRIQTNAYEYIQIPFVLHASAADSDGDGIPDHEEDTHPDGYFDPNQDTTDLYNPDTDGDGASDGDEQAAGTSPQDPASLFAIHPPVRTDAGLSLHWSTVAGRTYAIYGTTNLLQGFQPLETNLPWTTTSHTDTLHHADGQYFYQIRIEK